MDGTRSGILEPLSRDWLRVAGVAAPRCLDVHGEDTTFRPDLFTDQPARAAVDYLRSGVHSLAVLEHVLACAGRSFDQLDGILDFACGYGRMLRFLVDRVPPERIWASDIQPDALAFVAERLGVRTFASARRPEDVAMPRRFELIHVGSLFTHLPRPTFERFLQLLGRALLPGGLLVFSTHSPEVLTGAEDPSGFTFHAISEIHSLPATDYGSTFVAPAVVQSICSSRGLGWSRCAERELWRIQDVHVAAAEPIAGMERWTHAAIANGTITTARVDAAGHAWIGGFARVPTCLGEVAGVRVTIDGERQHDCAIGVHPARLPRSEGGAHFTQWDWYVEGPAPELLDGEHTVCAAVCWPGGQRSCFDARIIERIG